MSDPTAFKIILRNIIINLEQMDSVFTKNDIRHN